MKLVPRSRVTGEDVLDGMTTAVISVDDALRVTSLNSACEGLFGVSRRMAIGAPVGDAVPHLKPHEPRLRTSLATVSGFIEREIELRRNGDPPVTVDWTVTPFLSGNKKPGLLMELLPLNRHIRISRDEQLQAHFDASRELIRGLAHEIKNPLGGIRGAAQLLEREYPDDDHREYTRVIIREADRLQNLVNRMLGPNRVPEKSLLNIHEVLEHVRRLVQAEAPPGVELLRDYDPSIPELEADREQMVQAVLNLLRNALQATGSTGTIILRTRTRRQFTIGTQRHRLVAQIDIEDSGPGIPASMLEKIFFPMVTTRAEGTGLGLPIAQYLVHSHGGLIECRSRPGCTVFTILLPLEMT
ncbi:PAS domain-containing protein [Sinimarinibacterium sp. CAU 1509]|uniref:nitrogen regulation protein NR(II) n=1 Tax=Sinimarinibacterium sp. CAU 1509 TaxID=2562283 RepID=UPI0010AD0E45|nr:nitrogen regulation protein NR(II) [Sinimarinibacterium sp. CAU 1509]TJY59869.1 PAS domain-containing protein [Sinimarinibacterium sp. CAU 1509]